MARARARRRRIATVRLYGAHPRYRVGLVGWVTALEGETSIATARNSATVAGWTLVSRATGLLRVVVIGTVLGPTYFANSFQASYSVPSGPGRCLAKWLGGCSGCRPRSWCC
jgi:hypothetical protein